MVPGQGQGERGDTDRWRPAQLSAVGVGLAPSEGALLGQLGPPATQLRTLRHLGDAWADPVAGVLAVMTLLAELLVAYLLVAVALRWLSVVPGSIGRLATRVAFLVTPVVVRRTLDVLVGARCWPRATVAIAPATAVGHRGNGACPALASWPGAARGTERSPGNDAHKAEEGWRRLQPNQPWGPWTTSHRCSPLTTPSWARGGGRLAGYPCRHRGGHPRPQAAYRG